MKKYNLNGKVISVRPEHEQQFLENNPTATLVVGNQGDSNQGANVESQTSAQNPQQENTELESVDGSLESQEEPDNGVIASLSGMAGSFARTFKGLSSYTEGLELYVNELISGREFTGEERLIELAKIQAKKRFRSISSGSFTLPASSDANQMIEKLEANVPTFDTSITEDLSEGNIAQASKRTVDGFLQSIPSFIAASLGPAGLVVLGASTAGNKFEEEIEKESDSSTGSLLANATGSGTIEATFELVTRGLLKKTGLIAAQGNVRAAKEFLEQGAKNIVSKIGSKIGNVAEEGLSEAATELASAGWDKLSLGREIDYNSLAYQMSDAFIVGGFSGGAISTIGSMNSENGKKKAESTLMSEEVKASINVIGAEINKLAEDLPKASPEGKALINEKRLNN